MNRELSQNTKIAVWFSCGAASAVAAKLTVTQFPDAEVRILNNPVAEEHEDNQRFLRDVEKWINRPIERVTASNYPSCSAVDVWNTKQFMSQRHYAPCTFELKKRARQEWEATNKVDFHVLGFTADEKGRHERFVKSERANVIPILIDAQLTKNDCFHVLHVAGIRLPKIYELGYPNANCIGCVKASSPTYWNHVRKIHPQVFAARAQQSRKIGARLVRANGKRIFLDELDPAAKGYKLKGMDIECGLFCEESE